MPQQKLTNVYTKSGHPRQYCSKAYRALQSSYKMQTSMSNKGNCWDNAPMESFFGTLKTEVYITTNSKREQKLNA